MMVAWDVLLLASSIWAIRVALRQLRAAKPTVDRRTLRLGYVILAVQGVALLGIGQVAFFLAGRAPRNDRRIISGRSTLGAVFGIQPVYIAAPGYSVLSISGIEV
jgi:hypothetical protein